MFQPFGTMMWGTLNNFLLVAIPLFVFMGEILVRGGVTERMYNALADWLNPLPGRPAAHQHRRLDDLRLDLRLVGRDGGHHRDRRLPHLPRAELQGELGAGTVASGATLGILIPPSINLIIYGAITNTSIGKLFTAGILPGLMLASMFMLTIILWSSLDHSIAGKRVGLAPWPCAARG
jgi:C4-dicarboxylate transporter, DctM subunit